MPPLMSHPDECRCDKCTRFDFEMWTQELSTGERVAWLALEAVIAEGRQG